MEAWKPVLNYEGVYEVSSEGNVRRCDGARKIQRCLRPAPNHAGYLNVNLSRNSCGRTFFVHRLVIEAFIGPRPGGMTINHKNGVRTDNRIENLEYLTHHENILHAIHITKTFNASKQHGDRHWARTHPQWLARGEKHSSSKLNDGKVRLALQLLKEGKLQQREIAEIVGISQTQIWRIKTGQSWAHITATSI